MNRREISRQTSENKQMRKHLYKLGNRTNRWSKVQADTRCPNNKKQLKQQVYYQYISILSEISQTEYVRQLQNSRKKV